MQQSTEKKYDNKRIKEADKSNKQEIKVKEQSRTRTERTQTGTQNKTHERKHSRYTRTTNHTTNKPHPNKEKAKRIQLDRYPSVLITKDKCDSLQSALLSGIFLH